MKKSFDEYAELVSALAFVDRARVQTLSELLRVREGLFTATEKKHIEDAVETLSVDGAKLGDSQREIIVSMHHSLGYLAPTRKK